MYNHKAASTETPGQQLDTTANQEHTLSATIQQKGAGAMCHRPKEQEYKLLDKEKTHSPENWRTKLLSKHAYP